MVADYIVAVVAEDADFAFAGNVCVLMILKVKCLCNRVMLV